MVLTDDNNDSCEALQVNILAILYAHTCLLQSVHLLGTTSFALVLLWIRAVLQSSVTYERPL